MDSSSQRRVYMDNAATSWPKLPSVLEAVQDYLANCGATSGRGAYRSAIIAENWVGRARQAVAKLIGASAEEIAFCSNGTHALNQALYGLLKPGDEVITCELEHNSVLRPLVALRDKQGVTLKIAPSEANGVAAPGSIHSLISEQTSAVVVGQASNVTGWATDIAALEIPESTHFIVDASQTLGYLPIDVRATNISVLAAAAHKGLGAIGGTGLIYVRKDLHSGFRPLLRGGTGRKSNSIEATPEWPEMVEVGNLNIPGIISVAVAAEHLLEDPEYQDQWRPAFRQLFQGLSQMPEVQIVGAGEAENLAKHLPVVSLQIEGWDAHDLAAILDSSFGIEVRAGWHCAALAHRAVGTEADGGTLRLSPGRYTTAAEVTYVLESLKSILTV